MEKKYKCDIARITKYLPSISTPETEIFDFKELLNSEFNTLYENFINVLSANNLISHKSELLIFWCFFGKKWWRVSRLSKSAYDFNSGFDKELEKLINTFRGRKNNKLKSVTLEFEPYRKGEKPRKVQIKGGLLNGYIEPYLSRSISGGWIKFYKFILKIIPREQLYHLKQNRSFITQFVKEYLIISKYLDDNSVIDNKVEFLKSFAESFGFDWSTITQNPKGYIQDKLKPSSNL